MPTYQRLPRFDIDWETLTPAERQRFRAAVGRFIDDLEAGRPFRAGLRVKGVQGTANIMEMTFAPDGRASWLFGTEVRPGEPHVVWRRIGTHAIFRSP
jgi:hypothetical protein